MSNPSESCVETPAAPDWLSKLESRREKIGSRGKLGHESGAGAPCNECGDKCPGLDLHFWRKVCRNCKCRKDQHLCQDDDLSGWAQFEILGQIRSKPAYIKIKALADQKVKLDWIPPNATPDVVSDYMDNLGTNQIPVAGSDAAAKRRQQLEFQVPPHDLDAKLCDNLTESETAQLEQYVKKIRENCVGQGIVVRVGEINHGITECITEGTIEDKKMKILEKLQETSTNIINDNIVIDLLNSDKLSNALLNDRSYSMPTPFVAFSQLINSDILPKFAHLLCKQTQEKLKTIPINIATAKSVIRNGPFYDKILTNLAGKNLIISNDPVLQPIKDFRREYLVNDYFKKDIDQVVTANMNQPIEAQYATPLKSKTTSGIDTTFNSPIPVRKPIQTKFSSLLKQDTPMRKVKFGGVTVAHILGLPFEAKIEKDKILSTILGSEPLRNAIQNPLQAENNNLIVALTPMSPTSDDDMDIFNHLISPATKMKIEKLGLNKNCVQSAVVNGPYYDQLFRQLNARGINFGNCKLLAPMEQFRQELLGDLPFQKEIANAVQHLPDSEQIAICTEPFSFVNQFCSNPFKTSNSSDSGFESKPPTPNYSTFPDDVLSVDNISTNIPNLEKIDYSTAKSGEFLSIPGIEDMNMYPSVILSTDHSRELIDFNKNLNDLKIAEDAATAGATVPVPVLKCKECEKFIMSGEVAVKAERTTKEIAWHPQCFKCNGCRELLADLVYFFYGGNVYCGRDLAIILKIPRCQACDELIFTKEYTAAEGATFHIKHFCCYQCDLALAGQQYIPDEKTNMPLCLKCYDEYYAEKCQNCKKIIGPTEQGVAWGKIHWHGHCFMCSGINCGKSLIGGRFCVKENLPFCSSQCVKSVLQ